MSLNPTPPRAELERGPSRVLPFRGGEARVPSSALVRQALEVRGIPDTVVRSATALTTAISEGGRAGEAAARLTAADLSDRTGLSAAEVAGGLQALHAAGIVEDAGASQLRLDPDVLCTLPALSKLNWEESRRSLQRQGARIAPALALLRELGRLSPLARDGAGEWLQPSVQQLAAETLYGRTAVTQAIGELCRAGLLEKADQPTRSGLRVRITRRAFDGSAQEPEAPNGAPAPAEAGVVLRISGAELRVPAGSRLDLPPGLNYRLTIGPDGIPVVEST